MSKNNILKEKLETIYENDVKTILRKNKEYGESWKGEFYSAFENCRRKWDRMYNQSKENNFDVINLIIKDEESLNDDGVIESIRDLRAYLALIESEVLEVLSKRKSKDQLANERN